MDKIAQSSYAKALRGSTHFIRSVNEMGFDEKINPKFLRTSKRFIQFGFSLKILKLEGQVCIAQKSFKLCTWHSSALPKH